MKLENQTDWDGRHLRKLCGRVIDKIDGNRKRTITIKTSKSTGKDSRWEGITHGDPEDDETAQPGLGLYRGRASLGHTGYLYMGVPKVERKVNGRWMKQDRFLVKRFARVLEHELFHQHGLRHGEMADAVRWCKQDIDYVDDIVVESKPSFEYQGNY